MVVRYRRLNRNECKRWEALRIQAFVITYICVVFQTIAKRLTHISNYCIPNFSYNYELWVVYPLMTPLMNLLRNIRTQMDCKTISMIDNKMIETNLFIIHNMYISWVTDHSRTLCEHYGRQWPTVASNANDGSIIRTQSSLPIARSARNRVSTVESSRLLQSVKRYWTQFIVSRLRLSTRPMLSLE